MITKERIESRAALRQLKQPLFDTGHILTGAATIRVNFFQAPQGQPIVAAGALKTEADTNLTQAGQLGRPQEFDLYGFALELIIVGNVAETTDTDLGMIYDTGAFEFYFGQQRPWLQVPADQVPNGTGIEGAVACANDGAAVNYLWAHNGEGASDAMYNFTIGKKPIPVGSLENFSARLDWPGGAITITGAAAIRARCFMKGVLYAAL